MEKWLRLLRNDWLCITEISILPVDSKKMPVGRWKHLAENLPTEQDFQQFNHSRVTGIGVIFGKVSGNAELIDIDCKYDTTGKLFDEFFNLICRHVPELWDRLTIAKTKNRGYHIFYKCPEFSGNAKLANRQTTEEEKKLNPKEKVKVLIETRGEGGYALAYPSPGYEFIQGDLSTVPTITPEQRKALFDIAKCFDEMPVPEYKPVREDKPSQPLPAGDDLKPGDDYNQKTDYAKLIELLESEGWSFVFERGNKIAMKRPGATTTYSGYVFKDSCSFFCHSSSTEFPHEEKLSPFAVYTFLKHNGDFSAAGKDLAAKGYGARKTSVSTVSNRFQNRKQQNEAKKADSSEIRPVLEEKTESVSMFPLFAFPKRIQAIIEELAEKNGHPADYYGTGILAVTSVAVGNTFKAKMKNGWEETGLIFAGLVGSPGAGKTPALSFCMKPVRKMDDKLEAEYLSKKERYQQEEAQLQKGEKMPTEAPQQSQVVTNDFTIESLYEVLRRHPRGIIIHRDELIAWIHTFNQYRKGADEQFWLSTWSNQPITVNRKNNSEPIKINNPFLPVIGGIQPGVLEELFSDKREDNGFIDRMLFAFPDTQESPLWIDEQLDLNVFTEYDAYISKLFELDEEAVLLLGNNPQVIKYYNSIIKRANEAKDEQLKSLLHKVPTHFARIALLIEMLRYATGEIKKPQNGDSISIASIQSAERLAEYFIQTAKKVRRYSMPLAPDEVYSVADMIREGYSYSQISAELQISKGTITKMKKKHPEVFR
jgi:hypothetical protein